MEVTSCPEDLMLGTESRVASRGKTVRKSMID